MGLSEQIKRDIEQITSNAGDFGVSLSFKAPDGTEATVTGYYADHSNAYSLDGQPVTGEITSVAVSEQFLIDQNYPTRNQAGLITFNHHLVTISYADGRTVKYRIVEWKPDYTVNLIVLLLGRYNGVN